MDHTPLKPYVYHALPSPVHTRLVNLYPGDVFTGLRFSIETVSLNDNPVYEAISYVWGELRGRNPVDVEDEDPPLRQKAGVLITTNLKAALLRLRYRDRPRRLWIDNVCINQDDDDEKGQQIQIMPRIYGQASMVLIWLGEEDRSTSLAWQCFEMVKASLWELPDAEREACIRVPPFDSFAKWGLPQYNSEAFNAVVEMFHRPWFSRAWVFQESTLAQQTEVHCGPFCFTPGAIVGTIAEVLRREAARWDLCSWVYKEGAQAFEVLAYGLHLRAYPQSPSNSLAFLMSRRRGSLARDPRDLAYSLFGVAKDYEASGLKPDYHLSFQDLYQKLAIHFIGDYCGLRILGHVNLEDRSDELPSWVPDWRHSAATNQNFTFVWCKVYNAMGSSKPLFYDKGGPNELCLRGSIVDAIDDISEQAVERSSMDMRLPSSSQVWHAKTKQIAVAGLYQPTNEPLDVVFHRTRCADKWDAVGESSEEVLSKNPERLYRLNPDALAEHLHKNSEQSEDPEAAAWAGSNMRRFFVTDRQYMGLAPGAARRGDKICLVAGAEVPLLLRPKGDKYEFVGESYVHGLMEGEGMADLWAAPDRPRHTDTDIQDGLILQLLKEDHEDIFLGLKLDRLVIIWSHNCILLLEISYTFGALSIVLELA